MKKILRKACLLTTILLLCSSCGLHLPAISTDTSTSSSSSSAIPRSSSSAEETNTSALEASSETSSDLPTDETSPSSLTSETSEMRESSNTSITQTSEEFTWSLEETSQIEESTVSTQTSSRKTFPSRSTSRSTSEEEDTSSSETSSRNPIDIILNPTDKEDDEGTLADPYTIGETALFDGLESIFDPFKAEVSVDQIFRGAEALQMVKDASAINPSPDNGYEYFIAQVRVKIIESKNSEIVGVSPYFFSLAREDGRMYGDTSLFRSVTPVLEPLREGETSIAYIVFQVSESDENPYIVFLSRANGGIWFTTGSEEAAASSFENIRNANNTYATSRETISVTQEDEENER